MRPWVARMAVATTVLLGLCLPPAPLPAESPGPSVSRARGLVAWSRVYSVLVSPRCLNCHTATGYPQQGDDRHRHLFHVVRGEGGFGVPALMCGTCHQAANADSTGVPGARGWHLAPLSMAWQDSHNHALSSAQVCRVVRNSHMTGPALIRHMQEEPLVRWGFAPGLCRDGTRRSLPPLTQAELVQATRTWVEAGMPCPENR